MATNYVIGWNLRKLSIFKKTLINLSKEGRSLLHKSMSLLKKKKNKQKSLTHCFLVKCKIKAE